MKQHFSNRIAEAEDAMAVADAVLVGGGAGLSAAAGLEYGGERFSRHFAEYIERYGLEDMYSAMFARFPTPEERWGYVSRHIQVNRYDAPVGDPYRSLFEIAGVKDIFVITTNVDAQFFKAGFEEANVFASQGDYGLFQCETPCHDRLYDNEAVVGRMVAEQRECRVPSELLPRCPVCGGDLVPHLRVDGSFVENDNWREAGRRYRSFVENARDQRLVLLELGVGYNTPGIIRFPFERIATTFDHATLIRINRDHAGASPGAPDENLISFDEDTNTILQRLASAAGSKSDPTSVPATSGGASNRRPER